ncbi:MAG: DUF86 domain-containing protein, partial [Pseudolabrys sp.]
SMSSAATGSSPMCARPSQLMRSMPFDPTEAVLRDFLRHIDYVEEFVEGHDWPTFRNDPKTVFAVTSCLEIISEASRRLPFEIKERHPAIDWRSMAGAGNVYRHDYDDIETEFIWYTVIRALSPLRAVIEIELAHY